MKTERFQRIN